MIIPANRPLSRSLFTLLTPCVSSLPALLFPPPVLLGACSSRFSPSSLTTQIPHFSLATIDASPPSLSIRHPLFLPATSICNLHLHLGPLVRHLGRLSGSRNLSLFSDPRRESPSGYNSDGTPAERWFHGSSLGITRASRIWTAERPKYHQFAPAVGVPPKHLCCYAVELVSELLGQSLNALHRVTPVG